MPKGKPPASVPLTRVQRSLIAQFQRNARRAAERIERSPWTLGIRAARAEAELTGTNEAFDDLVRRYKKYEARAIRAVQAGRSPSSRQGR
jgi:hypothetical protein